MAAREQQMTRAEAEEEMSKVEMPLALVECLDEVENSSLLLQHPRVMALKKDHKKSAHRSFVEYFIQRRLLDLHDFFIHIDVRFANPEFGPPGVMAVTKVDKNGHEILLSKYLGSVNPQECYPLFKKSMKELRKFIKEREEYENAPWLIHSFDYFKLGKLRICDDVITIFKPAAVVQLYPDQRMANDLQNSGDGKFTLIQFDSQVHAEYYKSIHDYMCLADNRVRHNNKKTRRIKKFERHFQLASYKTVSLDTCGIGSIWFKGALNFSLILNEMSNKLVAVCKFPTSAFSETTPKKLIKNAENFSNEFIGYGIVQSIDWETNEIELFTPVSQDILNERGTCLVTAENFKFQDKLCNAILAIELVERMARM